MAWGSGKAQRTPSGLGPLFASPPLTSASTTSATDFVSMARLGVTARAGIWSLSSLRETLSAALPEPLPAGPSLVPAPGEEERTLSEGGLACWPLQPARARAAARAARGRGRVMVGFSGVYGG